MELIDFFNNVVLFIQIIKQRQTHQTIGIAVALRQITAIVFLSVKITIVQAQVMKYCMNAINF